MKGPLAQGKKRRQDPSCPARVSRHEREHRDQEIIERRIRRLNREALDALRYQRFRF